MRDFGDYQDEMSTYRSLDDQTVEALLAGRLPHDQQELAPLASLLAEVRSVGHGEAPKPNAALASILTDGLPADLTTDAGDVSEAATSSVMGLANPATGLTKWKRVPSMISSLVKAIGVKLAALGLAAKAAVVLTATAAVAAGAAAADLPQAVSDAFDRGEQHAPAGEPEDAEFGVGVSEDATDEDDRGVNGPDVAEEARERAANRATGASEDNPANEAASDGLNRARENTVDTPARIPDQVGPGTGELQRPEGTPEGQPDSLPSNAPEGTPQGQPEVTAEQRPDARP